MKATLSPREVATLYLGFESHRLPDGTEADFLVVLTVHSRLLRCFANKAIRRAIAQKLCPTKLCHGAIEMLAIRRP